MGVLRQYTGEAKREEGWRTIQRPVSSTLFVSFLEIASFLSDPGFKGTLSQPWDHKTKQPFSCHVLPKRGSVAQEVWEVLWLPVSRKFKLCLRILKALDLD